jgi:hypothetical protein
MYLSGWRRVSVDLDPDTWISRELPIRYCPGCWDAAEQGAR